MEVDLDPGAVEEGGEAVSVRLQRCIDICDLLVSGPASRGHRWLTELSESLGQAITSPVSLTFCYDEPRSRGYHAVLPSATVQLLTLLRDSMLRLRYEEASEYLIMLIDCCRSRTPLTLEPALHRCGLEIIYCLGDRVNQNSVEEFVTLCKSLHPLIRPHSVITEQCLYLLTTKGLSEAAECMSALPKEVSSSLVPKATTAAAKLLFRAYRGFVSYLQWESHALAAHDGQSQVGFSQSLRLDSLAEKALDDLRCVNSEPGGVWDIFILCQIKLLLHSGQADEARALAAGYKDGSGDNPNAHSYLIDLLGLQADPAKVAKTREALKEYCAKWPSDKRRALEYVSAQQSLEQPECLVSAIVTYFSLLDYNCHRYDEGLWSRFGELLDSALSSTSLLVRECVNSEWLSRASWWTPYHFPATPPAPHSTTPPVQHLHQIKLSVLDKLKQIQERRLPV